MMGTRASEERQLVAVTEVTEGCFGSVKRVPMNLEHMPGGLGSWLESSDTNVLWNLGSILLAHEATFLSD